ncbi:uncharacterized protein LOC129800601 [Phlebotomus papatasi]|uniref:uncharacterized protein LOC129800601 n=1 Tax=Phlebotomus papatasi TaxID=29031 RepID=UPI00248432E9|nr:uncharacterized protein LOC129800601 [Phlebotomus papatasi]
MPQNQVQNQEQSHAQNSAGSCVGFIENYIPEESGDFEDYIERMEQFFHLNGIEEDKRKCAAFITFAGQLCLKILKAAIQPEKVSSKSYKDIIGILKEKFAPKRSVTAERFKFHERRQQEGESISEYVSELQVLAQTCNFGNFLKDALRDKLVCGIQSKTIQGRLLAEDKSFEDTLKRALAMELAERNAQLMQPSGEIAAMYTRQKERGSWNRKTRKFDRREREETRQIRSKKRNKSPIKCFRCGQWSYHIAADCTAARGKRGRKESSGINQLESESEESNNSSTDNLEYRVHTMRLGALVKKPHLSVEETYGTVSSTIQQLSNSDRNIADGKVAGVCAANALPDYQSEDDDNFEK